jgi:hypothetical protein
MIKGNKTNYLIMVEFVICFFIIFFTIRKESMFASYGFTLSFILLLNMFVRELFVNKIQRNELINLLLLVTIVFLSLVWVICGNLSMTISFGYFKKYFIFCSTLIYLFVICKTEVDQRIIRFIICMNILLGLLYCFNYYIGNGRSYYGNTDFLTFNFTNPNLTAMWLFQTIVYLTIGFKFFNKKKMKFLCLIIVIFLIKFLVETKSRNSWVALTVYAIAALYLKLKRNIRLNKLTLIILVLFPIIFASVYLLTIKNLNIKIFKIFISEGKDIFSRYRVWSVAFLHIREHLIIGAYNQISEGTGASQMLNTHIDIWASYGTIVFLLTMVYMVRIVFRISSVCVSKMQTLGLIAFLSVIEMGIGEAAMFSGGQGIYILGCTFLLIARYEKT